jgi:hypothetical protein
LKDFGAALVPGRRCFGRAQLNRCHGGRRAIAATVDVSSAATKPSPRVLHPIEATPDRAFASLGLTSQNAARLRWSNRRNFVFWSKAAQALSTTPSKGVAFAG